MPGFAGFDSSGFPGLPQMRWLRANTNLVWCGYYLAPAPSHPDTGWMGQRQALRDMGWGIAPLYVGQQLGGPGSHGVSEMQGTIDGAEAAKLMDHEGFDAGSTVYLDLEDGPPFKPPRSGYVAAWIDAVQNGGFQPGVYCSHAFAADVSRLRPGTRIWAFKVDTTDEHRFDGTNFPDLHPAGSGFPTAVAWQLGQNCRLQLPSAPLRSPLVDLNTALSANPGAASVAIAASESAGGTAIPVARA